MRSTVCLTLVLAAAPALATKYTEPTKQPKQPASQPTSLAQEVAASAQSTATGKASADGTQTTSIGFNSRDRALGLALPPQIPVNPPALDCQITTASKGVAGIGASGRTKFDPECVRFHRCVAIADRLAEWGQYQLAVEQLVACDGARVQAPAEIAPPPHITSQIATSEPAPAAEPPVRYVTHEELERAFRAAVGKGQTTGGNAP